MAKSKHMPGTIGLKLLGFARTRIQRYVPPSANNLSTASSALPPSWRQATEEPLIWQQAEPDSEPLTPVIEQPEEESPPVVEQKSGFAPDLLRMLEMHEERDAEENSQVDTSAAQDSMPVAQTRPQVSSQPIMRKPKSGVMEQHKVPPMPRPKTQRPEQVDYQQPDTASYQAESFTADTFRDEVVVRPPSGEVHETIQPKRPRPKTKPAAVDVPSGLQRTESVQRKPAAEQLQSDPDNETFDTNDDVPETYSPAPDSYFETEVPEPSRSERNTPPALIQRAVQNDTPAQNTSSPAATPQPSNPYFQVSGVDEEVYGDTEPIIYSQETVQRKPAAPQQQAQPPVPNTPHVRPTPRLDAIQRSVESVEQNLQAVQRNLDSIQRFVDEGKPESEKPRSNPNVNLNSSPNAPRRTQPQADNPSYSQLDVPQQELVYGFDDETPDATTPYTPVQVDRETPAAQVNRSAAKPDEPAMSSDMPYDQYADTPEASYQGYTDYSAGPDTYQPPSETWSDVEQGESEHFEPPVATDYRAPETPATRQAPRQIVQAKRVPVNRPLQRVEDYSDEYQAEPDATDDNAAYSTMPNSESPEADLLRLLNLPTDTPVSGLRSSSAAPSTPNANIISRKPLSPNSDNAWQGEIDISEPYNEAEADEDDDYTPLPNQIQPISLDQVLDSSPGRQADTPIQRVPEHTLDDDEQARVQPVSLEQAILSSQPNPTIQRAEESAPSAATSPSAASPNGESNNTSEQNGQNKNQNVDKLAREVYRLLRDKLRIEQERRSDKS